MSVTPFDHPFLSGLLGDAEIASYFSARADISAMIAFEVALAQAEADEGIIPSESAEAIAAAVLTFEPDIRALNLATSKDGVVVPELVRQLRHAVGQPHADHIHFGTTSQDVIDTSLALRLGSVLGILSSRLAQCIAALETLLEREGNIVVMAHTRMQAAILVPAARKITSWREPLIRDQHRLTNIQKSMSRVTFGGAAGTLEKIGQKAPAVSERLIARLGLDFATPTSHSERDGTAELASVLSLITGSLGKMGSDIALAAQTEIGEIRVASGGHSSSMAHKANPIGAETLVAFARFSATLLAGMHHALVHENERSGSAWMLEWMLLPQMLAATGVSLRTAIDLIGNLSFVALNKR